MWPEGGMQQRSAWRAKLMQGIRLGAALGVLLAAVLVLVTTSLGAQLWALVREPTPAHLSQLLADTPMWLPIAFIGFMILHTLIPIPGRTPGISGGDDPGPPVGDGDHLGRGHARSVSRLFPVTRSGRAVFALPRLSTTLCTPARLVAAGRCTAPPGGPPPASDLVQSGEFCPWPQRHKLVALYVDDSHRHPASDRICGGLWRPSQRLAHARAHDPGWRSGGMGRVSTLAAADVSLRAVHALYRRNTPWTHEALNSWPSVSWLPK